MKRRSTKRLMAANTFATLGYVSVLFQWVWALLLLAYPFITQRPDLFLPAKQPEQQPQALVIDPSLVPLVTVVAVIATITILILTFITLARLPKTIGKKAAGLSRTTAKAVIPAITHHKTISKKERQRLSHKIIIALKVSAIILPLLLLIPAKTIEELPVEAVWAIGIFSAICSVGYFGVQYLIARIGKLQSDELW